MAGRNRIRLVATTSLAGLLPLAALLPAPALGQAFEAGFASSTAFRIPGANADIIQVSNPVAEIIWTPNDISGTGPINFLPAGRVATFVNDSGVGDYTVLNRVLPSDPTRPIQFNGRVESFVDASVGGTVLFYSPGGVIVGPTGVFDVGSLVLTTLNPDLLPGGLLRLRGTAGSGAEVNINAGALLTARATGGYVALVAPRVVMSGRVEVDGTAAYVAAEGVDLTINAGLYTIAVTDGTDTGNGTNGQPEAINHSGETIVSGTSAVAQRVVMAAVSKNDAITMLVGGSVRGSVANSAFVSGSDIVLSAGFPGAAGGGAISVPDDSDVNPVAAADLTITATDLALPLIAEAHSTAALIIDGAAATYNSVSLLGRVDSLVSVGLGSPATLDVGGSFVVGGGDAGRGRTAFVELGAGAALRVAGTMLVDLRDLGDLEVADARGGAIGVTVGSGAMLRANALTLRATAIGFDTGDTVPGGLGIGGSAGLTVNGGSVEVGNLNIDASGTGFGADASTGGRGGTAALGLVGGNLTASRIDVRADSTSSGNGDPETDINGSGGFGGDANMFIDNGATLEADSLQVAASFFGDGMRARRGTGGNASIVVGASAPAFVTIFEGLSVVADASGGDSGAGIGGSGIGGVAQLQLQSGEIILNQIVEGLPSVFVSASGFGGDSLAFNRSAGGFGRGGTAFLTVGANALLGSRSGETVAPLVFVEAIGGGGEHQGVDFGRTGGNGGFGRGGDATVDIAGVLSVQRLSLTASGLGGAGGDSIRGDAAGDGGDGFAGNLQLDIRDTGTLRTVNRSRSSAIELLADGRGGRGGDLAISDPSNTSIAVSARGGNGGFGTGGRADFLIADGGTLTTAGVIANATTSLLFGVSASGGIGGNAQRRDFTDLGDGVPGGAGGGAQGGRGSFTVAGLADPGAGNALRLDVRADAIGGNGAAGSERQSIGVGGAGGGGGTAGGGNFHVQLFGTGQFVASAITMSGTAQGGSGGLAAIGGRGGDGGGALSDPTGTGIALSLSGTARLSAGTIALSVAATAGQGGGTAAPSFGSVTPDVGGRGGDAAGGIVRLNVSDAATLSLSGQLNQQGPPPALLPHALRVELGVSAGAGANGYSPTGGLSGSAGGAGGRAAGGVLSADINAGFAAVGMAVTQTVSGGAGGRGGALGIQAFDSLPLPTGGAGGQGGDAFGGVVDIRFGAAAGIALSNLVVLGMQTAGNGGDGGAAPSPANPDFINAVNSFGPQAFDFGAPGNGGGLTSAGVVIQSDVAALSLDTLQVQISGAAGSGGIGTLAFVDGNGDAGLGIFTGGFGSLSGLPEDIILNGAADITFTDIALSSGFILSGTGELTGTQALLTSDASTIGVALPITLTGPITRLFASAPEVQFTAPVVADAVEVFTGTLSVAAPLDGRDITLVSSVVDIIDTIGSANTERLTMGIDNPSVPAFIGGADPGLGFWYLPQDSIDGLRATQMVFRAQGDLVIGDANFTGSANGGSLAGPVGAAPSLVFATSGNLLVNGALELTGADVGDQLGLIADGVVRIDTASGGGVAVRDPDGLAGGWLYLRGGNIEVASDPLLAALSNAAEPTDRNDLLRDFRDVAAAHVLLGNRVSLRAGGHAWVANTGSAGNFAGILSGNGGLDVATAGPIGQLSVDLTDFAGLDVDFTGSGPVELIAFGAATIGGQPVTGDFFALTEVFYTPGDLTSESFVNNCQLPNGCTLPAVGGFEGDFTISAGDISAQRAVGSDIITIGGANNATGVLTWAPRDISGNGAIDFLPAGNTGVFQGAAGLGDFTIINRVLPSDPKRPIMLNGSITSRLDSGAVGGRVLFFAPAGVIVGATASLDIGSLFLSAADPVLQGNGVTWRFDGADAASAIQIDSGARINAAGAAVLVAPRVVMNGAVTVGGTAAYLAASDVDVTLDAATGDYDIGWGSPLTTVPGATVISIDGTTTSNGATTSGLVVAAPTGPNPFRLDIGGSIIGSFGRSTNIYSTAGVFDSAGAFSILYRPGAIQFGNAGDLSLRLTRADGTLFFGAGAVTLAPAVGGSSYNEIGGTGEGGLDIITRAGDALVFDSSAFLSGGFSTPGQGLMVSGDGIVSFNGPTNLTATGDASLTVPIAGAGILNISADNLLSVDAVLTANALTLTASGASGSVVVNAAPVAEFLTLNSAGTITATVDLAVDQTFAVNTGGSALLQAVSADRIFIDAQTLSAGNLAAAIIGLTGPGSGTFSLASLAASGQVSIDGATSVTLGGAISAPAIDIASPLVVSNLLVTSPTPGSGSFRFGDIAASGIIDISGGGTTSLTGQVSAGGAVRVVSGGALDVADIAATGTVDLQAEGTITSAGGITATTLTLTTNAGSADPGFAVDLLGTYEIDNLNVGAGGALTVSTPLLLTGFASLNALSVNIPGLDAGGDLTVVTAAGGAGLLISNNLNAANVFITGGPVSIAGTADVTAFAIDSAGDVSVTGDLITVGGIGISALGDIGIGGEARGSGIALTGNGLTVHRMSADTDPITLVGTGGTVSLNGLVQAPGLTITAANAPIVINDVIAVGALSVTGTGTGSAITLNADLDTPMGVEARFNAQGPINVTSDLTVDGGLFFGTSGGLPVDITLAAIDAGEGLTIRSRGGLTVTGLVSGGLVSAESQSNQAWAGFDADGVDLLSFNGGINVSGDISSGRASLVAAAGVVVGGDILADGRAGQTSEIILNPGILNIAVAGLSAGRIFLDAQDSLVTSSVSGAITGGSLLRASGPALSLDGPITLTGDANISATDVFFGSDVSVANLVITSTGIVNATSGAGITATGLVSIADATTINLTDPVSAGAVTLAADSITANSVQAGAGDLNITSASAFSSGALSGDNVIIASGGELTLGNVAAVAPGGRIDLDAGGRITTSGSISGSQITINNDAAGPNPAFTVRLLGSVAAVDLTVGAAGALTVAQPLSIGGIGDFAASSASFQSVSTGNSFLVSTDAGGAGLSINGGYSGRAFTWSGGPVTVTGGLTADFGFITANGAVDIGGAIVLSDNFVVNAASLTLGQGLQLGITATFEVNDLDIAGPVSVGSMLVEGNGSGSFTLGDTLTSVTGVTMTGASAITLGGAADVGGITLVGDTLAFGDVTARGRDIILTAVNDLTIAGSITGPSLFVNVTSGNLTVAATQFVPFNAEFTVSGDMVATAPLGSSGVLRIAAGGAISLADASTRNSISLFAGGGIATGALSSPLVTATGTDIALGPVTANSLTIQARGAVSLARTALADNLNVLSSTSISASALINANNLVLTSSGDAVLGEVTVFDRAFFTLGGGLTTGGLFAGDSLNATLGAGADLASLSGLGTLRITANAPVIIAGDLSGAAIDITLATDSGRMAVGGTTTSDSLVVSGNGPLVFGNIDATDFVSLSSGAGLSVGALSADTVVVNAADSVSVTSIASANDINVTTLGALTATGAVIAGGNVRLSGAAISVGGTLGGTALAATGTSISLHDLNLTGPADIAATARLDILAGGTIGDGVFTAGGDLVVGGPLEASSLVADAAGAVQFQQLFIANGLAIDAGAFAALGGPVRADRLDLTAFGALTAETINLSFGAMITAAGITASSITADTDLNITSSAAVDIVELNTRGRITLAVDGAAAIGDIRSRDFTLIETAVGQAVMLDAFTIDGVATVRTAGDLVLAGGTAGDIDVVTTGGSLTLTGSADARGVPGFTLGSVRLVAADAVNIVGDVTASSIELTGADLVIGVDASVGNADTRAVVIRANGNAQAVVVGGADIVSPGTFRLDADELLALRANGIRVDAGALALNVGAVQLAGSAAVSPNLNASDFELVSQGDIRIDAPVAITDAGANDTIRAIAGGLLHVARPGGSLTVTANNGALTGRIELTAGNRVLVASDSARAAVDAAGSLTARRDALFVNDTTPAPQGIIRADTIVITAGTAIQVQNSSGQPGQLAGIATGNGGLTLGRPVNAQPGVVEVIGYGAGLVQGDPLTGTDYTPTVQFTPGTLAAGSQINDCVLGLACAGSFQGDFVIEQGIASVVRSETLDTITVGDATPVFIRWTPYDSNGTGTIDFLPAANSGMFRGVDGLTNYVVINRILPSDPSRPISINGTVTSQISLGGNSITGGALVFYSPGGVLIGSSARLDVGSLLVTTADITAATLGSVTLASAADAQGEAGIDAGAIINANNENSIVALFGPRVRSDGDISVAGTAAFVAAEAGTLSFGAGNSFDVAITRGALVPTGSVDQAVGPQAQQLVRVGGSIGGAAAGAGQGRNLVVALAPRQGFASAVLTADVDWAVPQGGRATEILVAAGAGLTGSGGAITMPDDPQGRGAVAFLAGRYAGDVLARGTRSVIADASETAIDVLGNFTATSDFGTSLRAEMGGELRIAGTLTAGARPGATPTRGLVQIIADDGIIGIGGDVIADAPAATTADGALVSGGLALIDAQAGSVITIGGDVTLTSNGAGGPLPGLVPAAPGGGGLTAVSAAGASTITIAGDLTMTAQGLGSDPVAPGVIRGGRAQILADNSQIAVGNVRADARAFGAAGVTATGGGIVLAGSNGGSLTLGDLTAVTADPGASGGSVTFSGSLSGLDAVVVRTGDAGFANGLTAASLDVIANGVVTSAGAFTTAGALTISSGGGLDLAGLTATSLTLASSAGGVTLNQGATVTGAAVLSASGDVTAAAPIQATSLAITSATDIALAAVTTSGAVTTTGDTVDFNGALAANSLTVNAGTLTFGDTVAVAGLANITSGNAVSADALLSADNLVLNAAGPLLFDRLSFASADITSGGSVTVAGTSTLTGALGVTATGTVSFGGAVRASSVRINSNGALTAAAGITAPGNVAISARGVALGPVSADLLAITSFGPLSLDGGITAATVRLTALRGQGRIDVNGAITASNLIAMSADTVATIAAPLVAPTIDITASAIAITAGIGGAQTEFIRLATRGDGGSSATIGGGGGAGGFEIDANELLRLRADSILIDSGFGQGGPSLTIAGFTLQGPTSSQPNLNSSNLTIASGGDLIVRGLASIENAAGADVLALLASNDIRVLVDDGGGALVRAADGTLTGQLYMLGQRIIVARADGLDAIDDGLSGTALRTVLASNTGATRPEGYLQSGTILLRGGTDVLMQNSGGNGIYAGLTVGSGGLDIRQGGIPATASLPRTGAFTTAALDALLTSNGQQRVIVFGRQVSGTDTIVNAQFLPIVRVNVASVTSASEINGCNLVSGVCGSAILDDGTVGQIEMLTDMLVRPGVDSITGVANNSDDASPIDNPSSHDDDDEPPELPMMDARQINPLAPNLNGTLPEPVGGVGNEAIWSGEAGVNDLLLDVGTGVGNETTTIINPDQAGGGGGGDGGLATDGGGGGSTNSVGGERNPGTTGADQGGGGGGGGGSLGGAGTGGGSTNSIGSERSQGTAAPDDGSAQDADRQGPAPQPPQGGR